MNARFLEAQAKISEYELKLANLTQDFDRLSAQFNLKVKELEEFKFILIEREEMIGELNMRVSNLSDDLRNCNFSLETVTREKYANKKFIKLKSFFFNKLFNYNNSLFFL